MSVLCSLLLLWACEALRLKGLILMPLLILPALMLTFEKRWFALILNYFLPAGLILFLPFLHYAWLFYVSVLALYAPIRTLLQRFRSGWLGSLLMYLICNVLFGLALFGLSCFGVRPWTQLLPFTLALSVLAIEIGFLMLDVLYQLFAKLYRDRIRKYLFV